MNTIVRNILAVIVGLIVGGIVNMSLIQLSGHVIPPPAGVDPTNVESLKAGMHLFEAKHFLFPFLAHALGALSGAFVAALIAASHRLKFALAISAFNLVGGIVAVVILPAPVWYSALDLIVAYLPMGWLGGKLATTFRPEK